MNPKLRLVRPSSREQEDILTKRLPELVAFGFDIVYDDQPISTDWPYVASPTKVRLKTLFDALTEEGIDYVWCARGGYGASDLLAQMPWEALAETPARILIGFSDASALHSAIYAILQRPGLHAPMPATKLWGKDSEMRDLNDLKKVLNDLKHYGKASSDIAVDLLKPAPEVLSGKLFGGCMTVLTHLIGTPYFPNNLKDHIVFLEDTGENPARLMRALNQWLHSGVLRGVKALVIGYLKDMGETIPDCATYVYEEFARRTDLPVFATRSFGHCSPNFPLMIGADAVIQAGRLTWHYKYPALSGDEV